MGTILKNIQTEEGYNLCYIRGLILELSVKIKMLGCNEWWDLVSVSVRVKKKQKKTEELISKTDKAKPRKTWTEERTKDRTREGTDSDSKAVDKRAERNGCSPWHTVRNAKGKGGGGVSEKRKEQGTGGGVEKETVNGNRTKQTQKKWKDHGVKVGFQVSHTGAQNQESRPPFPVRAFNTAPWCTHDLGGHVEGEVWMGEQDFWGGRGSPTIGSIPKNTVSIQMEFKWSLNGIVRTQI